MVEDEYKFFMTDSSTSCWRYLPISLGCTGLFEICSWTACFVGGWNLNIDGYTNLLNTFIIDPIPHVDTYWWIYSRILLLTFVPKGIIAHGN